jgi:hypothetical protein
MPSADFCNAVKLDLSSLSESFHTLQTSRGKTQNFHCVSAGFIKRTSSADGRLRGHVPTRLRCVTPHIRFLFIAPQLWIELDHHGWWKCRYCRSNISVLQPTPHDVNLALLPAFGSATTWQEDFHLSSFVPCPAHTQYIERSLQRFKPDNSYLSQLQLGSPQRP